MFTSVSAAVESSIFAFSAAFVEPLARKRVVAHIDTRLFLKFRREPVNNFLVDVFAAEVCVAVGCFNLYNIVAPLQDRDVKGAAAEVENHNLFVLLFVKAVGKRRCGRLVDDALHIEPCNFTRHLSSPRVGCR